LGTKNKVKDNQKIMGMRIHAHPTEYYQNNTKTKTK